VLTEELHQLIPHVRKCCVFGEISIEIFFNFFYYFNHFDAGHPHRSEEIYYQLAVH